MEWPKAARDREEGARTAAEAPSQCFTAVFLLSIDRTGYRPKMMASRVSRRDVIFTTNMARISADTPAST